VISQRFTRRSLSPVYTDLVKLQPQVYSGRKEIGNQFAIATDVSSDE
jgi:hypothetical protein